MQRKTAADFPPEVARLFDGYVHGNLTPREFLDRAARYATPGVSAAAMLEMLRPNFAWGQQVPEDDERINAGWPAFESVLNANNVKYEMHTYPGTQHGFHNDATPRYDEQAAKLSWSPRSTFFKPSLKG